MEERWCEVPDSDGRFEVSDRGHVRRKCLHDGSWRHCLLTMTQTGRDAGYVKVKTGDRWWWVHRLVAEVFLPPAPQPDMEPDHLDGLRWRNCATNLEWVDRATNNRRVIERGNGRTQKLTEEEARNVRFLLQQGLTGPDVLKVYPQANAGIVSDIRTGRTWNW